MIKYLELTAPEESQFRQAKILSVAVNEGDKVAAGDTLFKVQSGNAEVALPSRLDGRVVEIIVGEGENISLMTPLILLETEVEKSTASQPIENGDDRDKSVSLEQQSDKTAKPPVAKQQAASKKQGKKKSKKVSPKPSKQELKRLEQQSLDLGDGETNDLDVDKPTSEGRTGKPEEAPAAKLSDSTQEATEQPENETMSSIKIIVPDIGIDSAKVIELLVNVGDTVAVDDPLITLESDKASMDVPSTAEGVVESIEVALDQDISEGDLILTLSAADGASAASESDSSTSESEPKSNESSAETSTADSAPAASAGAGSGSVVEVSVPDIGGDSAKVIEILVEVGSDIEVDDPLITLESDKASMDVPSTVAGTIESIEVSIDQDVSEGTLIAKVASGAASAPETQETSAKAEESKPEAAQPKEPAKQTAPKSSPATAAPAPASGETSHASPSVRRLARELGADLGKISGSGRKGRITKDDVKQFVKGVMTSGASESTKTTQAGSGIPEVPAVDFSKFGEIELQPLNKIKRLTAANLHRSWLNVPHVTHNDESNISDLESFRKQLNEEYKKQGKDIKLSPLAFIVKAVVNAMQTYPQFNASLEPGGENLILKKYFHIGIAVDTPNGLVVPVVRNADTKSVAEIAKEMGELAAKARDKKLTPADMSGACFTISSLGGIGGTGFTPIVNTPEVAILGVSRSKIQPVWNGSEFEPGMILPLSLSYDHRVIDGAEAARFTRQIAAVLEDVRRLAV